MKKILIIGLGLIGGSFAKALKSKDSSFEIYGYDNDTNVINQAKNSKIIEDFLRIDEKIVNFDLIVISSWLDSYQEIFEKISKFKLETSLIIDLGSLKNFIFDIVDKKQMKNFIACHPIAGSEKSGFENSSKDLFQDKKFIICKNEFNEEKDVEKIVNLAKLIGCEVEFVDAKKHDEIFALTSHLPQFLSFLTKDFIPKNIEKNFILKAFRLNNSNPIIWNDIFKINQKNIEKFYVEFFENLMIFAEKIDENQFTEVFEEINEISKNHLKNQENYEINEEFLEKTMIFRLLIVISYLKIKKINDFVNFAGSGFCDFISIIHLTKLPRNVIIKGLEKNKDEILNLIEEISS